MIEECKLMEKDCLKELSDPALSLLKDGSIEAKRNIVGGYSIDFCIQCILANITEDKPNHKFDSVNYVVTQKT